MKKVVKGLAAKGLAAVLLVAGVLAVAAGEADAARGGSAGRSGGPRLVSKGPVSKAPRFSSTYHLTHGVRFSHGHYFRGREHRQFRYRYWHARWRTYLFYDPGTRGWFYWSSPRFGYYPVSYASVLPPSGVEDGDTEQLPEELPPSVTPPPG
jgi:hypothetical protein